MTRRRQRFRCFYQNEIYSVKELCFANGEVSAVKLLGSDGAEFFLSGDDVGPVMQSTGLFDKNGVEIFESDRIRLYKRGAFVTAIIIFEKGLFCLQFDDGYKNIYPLNPENYEVMGHLFDDKR